MHRVVYWTQRVHSRPGGWHLGAGGQKRSWGSREAHFNFGGKFKLPCLRKIIPLKLGIKRSQKVTNYIVTTLNIDKNLWEQYFVTTTLIKTTKLPVWGLKYQQYFYTEFFINVSMNGIPWHLKKLYDHA